MNENLISKIKKLLTLGDSKNGATEAEMQLTLSHARRLAIANDIDLATLSQKETVMYEKIEKEELNLGCRFSVCQKFVTGILDVHFKVKIVVGGSRYGGRRMWIIGKISDVKVAEYVQNFLNVEFMHLWKVAAKQLNLPAKDRNSYLYGLYKGLSEKLAEEKNKTENSHFDNINTTQGVDFKTKVQQTYTLALVNEKRQIAHAVAEFFPKLGKSTAKVGVIHNTNAMILGFDAGRNISINRAIGDSNNQYLN